MVSMNVFKKLTTTNSIKVNAIFNSIYQILTMLVPLITAPYIARVLGVENNGLYSYYYSIVTYFVLLATFGFNDFGTKYIAEVRDNKEKVNSRFWSISYSKLILGLLTIAVYFIFSFSAFSNDKTAITLLLILSGYILSAVIDPTFFFQGNERFVSVSLRNIFIRVLTTIAIFCFVKSVDDLYMYALILSLGQVLASLIMFISFRGCGLKIVKVSKLDFIESFKGSFAYFLPGLAVTLFNSLNQTLLGIFGFEGEESGYYGQAIKNIGILSTLVGSINIIVLSRISYLQSLNDEEKLKKQIEKIFQVFRIASIPVTLGLVAITNTFLPAFLGDGYDKSTICTFILSSVVFLSPLNGLIGSVYYRPKNKIYLQTLFIVIASIVNIIICVIMIPTYKSYGASIGRVFAEVIQLPLLVFFSRKYLNYTKLLKTIVKPLISGIVMFIPVYFFVNYLSFNVWLRIFSGIFIGVFAYYFMELLLRDSFVINNTKIVLGYAKKIFLKKSEKDNTNES